MARNKEVTRKRGSTRRSKWIIAGLFLLGLIIGTCVGFYVHYYVLNPSPKKKVVEDASASTKEKKGTGTEPAAGDKKKYARELPADPAKVQQEMSYLSQQIGVRVEGTEPENAAAMYLKSELEHLGYVVGIQQFTLPNGQTSHNLVTADPGTSDKYTFLVGAHIDSRSGSPGANDDASGCAAVLEFARTAKGTKHLTEIRFLLFGSEEGYGPNRTPKRIGSTYYLSTQSPAERAKIVGMVSVDMVSVGPELHVRDWGSNSPGLAQSLVSAAQGKGLNAFQDPSEDSDHEPFGMAGIPAVWLERMLPGGNSDPKVHTAGDAMSNVSTNLVSEVVDLLRGYVLELDETYCKAAVAR